MFWSAPLRDGRTIQIRHQPLPNGDWVSTHEDITELGAARASANQRLQQQALIDWVPDYLWVKDTESRFVVVNRALSRRQRPCDAERYDRLDRFRSPSPEAAQEFRAIEQEIIASGNPMIDREEVVVDRSGAKEMAIVDESAGAQRTGRNHRTGRHRPRYHCPQTCRGLARQAGANPRDDRKERPSRRRARALVLLDRGPVQGDSSAPFCCSTKRGPGCGPAQRQACRPPTPKRSTACASVQTGPPAGRRPIGGRQLSSPMS